MTTIFTKIINKEIPAQLVHEDDVCVVLMDKFPGTVGQTLVIPRQEVDYIFDLPEATYEHIFAVAKKVAQVSDQVFDNVRSCIVVEGFEVPHTHIKIYPVNNETKDLVGVMTNTKETDDEELQITADKIRTAM